MNRYKILHHGIGVEADGEWVRYSDHVEAMKRVAGDAKPVAWLEAEESARQVSLQTMLRNGVVYSMRWHWNVEPKTSNPVWPIYAAPPAAPVAQGLTREALYQAIHDVLMEHGLSYTEDTGTGEKFPLVDKLCAPGDDTIKTGMDEIEILSEAILDVIPDGFTQAATSAVTEPLQGTQEPSASAQQEDRECSGREWWLHALPGSELAAPVPGPAPAALTDERILNAVGESHLLAIQGKSWQDAAQPIRALLATSPAALMGLPAVNHTLAGFRAGWIAVHGHPPLDQDIWNAGVRSGMERAAQPTAAAEADKRDAERLRGMIANGWQLSACDVDVPEGTMWAVAGRNAPKIGWFWDAREAIDAAMSASKEDNGNG